MKTTYKRVRVRIKEINNYYVRHVFYAGNGMLDLFFEPMPRKKSTRANKDK